MNDRFIIFSLPRCGSVTLMRSLNCHPDIRCKFEPFNKASPYNDIDYAGRVHDAASLDATMEDIWKTCNGIKHVWHPLGGPFPDGSEFNKLLISKRGQKIVFLSRRNDLRRLVSHEMAMQSRVWAILDDASRKRYSEAEFKPLDIAKIKSRLDLDARVTAEHRQRLIDNRIDFMELWYEDLYNPLVTREQRKETLNQILAFLGRDAIADDEAMARVHELFEPDRTKQSSGALYRKIPGIDEVERTCGSDQRGWLFKGDAI